MKKPDHPEVSVIIPAYNAEKYIEECLNSVSAQSFRELEIIVVNDASTDSTLCRVKNLMTEDNRIRVVDLPQNRGLSGARNAGIEESRGKFLCFLDSDDCLNPSAIEIMYGALKLYDAEICRVAFYRGKEYVNKRIGKVKYKVYTPEEALRLSLYQKVIMNPAWGMLIKRDIVMATGGFRTGTWYEDLDAFYLFFERAVRIVYIENPLYFYRENPSGFLSSWKDGRLDVLEVTDRMRDYFRRQNPELLKAAEDRRFSAHYNILLLMLKHGIDNPEAMQRCLEVVKKGRVRALLDTRVRLKNKAGAIASYLGLPFLRFLAR